MNSINLSIIEANEWNLIKIIEVLNISLTYTETTNSIIQFYTMVYLEIEIGSSYQKLEKR